MHEAFGVHMLNEEGKTRAIGIAESFDNLLSHLKVLGVDGRYLAIVTTKMEEACFFAKKGMASKEENQLKEEAK